MNKLLVLVLISFIAIDVVGASDSAEDQHSYLLRRYRHRKLTTATTSATAETTTVHRKLQWSEQYWFHELPASARSAASYLGYTEVTWNNNIETAIDRLGWAQLTSSQRSAASALGYGQLNWDGVQSYEELDYDELGQFAKYYANALGYYREQWDRSLPTYVDDLCWRELSRTQQYGAWLLGGWTERSWNGNDPECR